MTSRSAKSASPEGLVQRLQEAQKPGEVVAASGAWMGYRLAEQGFKWVSSRCSLERKDAGRFECLRLEPSHWNRAGRLVEFSIVSLEVHDQVVREWRRLNREVTVERPSPVEGLICAASFLDLSRGSRVNVTAAMNRVAAVEVACEVVAREAVPWFEGTRSSEHLDISVPEGLLRPTAYGQDLLEYLVSRNNREGARALIGRFLAAAPANPALFAEGRVMARRGIPMQWHAAQAMGWSGEKLGLVPDQA